MFPRHRPILALLAGAALMLAACFRQATDEAAGPVRPRDTGTEPWTIDGVRPGQSFAEAKRFLGEPREILGTTGLRTALWARVDTAVTFDQAGRVTEVMGSAVKAGPRTLVQGGATEAEVVQVLGPGKVQQSSRPKGSGVISLGSVHTGTTLIYDRDGVRFELCVFGEAAGHFLARRLP